MEKIKEITPNIFALYRYFCKITDENPDIIHFSKDASTFSKLQAFVPFLEKILQKQAETYDTVPYFQ